MNSDIYSPGQDHYFGGGVSESVLSPIVLGAMIVVILLVFGLPRKRVIAPLLVALFLIPVGQEIYALGVHWFVCRLIILAALGRAIADNNNKDGFLAGGFNSVDKAFVLSTICESAGFVLLYRDGNALINQFGFLIDQLGAYIIMRALIRDEECSCRAIKCLAFVCVILAFTMVREQLTLQNIFGQVGGASGPLIRENKIRSQGSFGHSLTAGAFAATLLPLFLLLWSYGKAKVTAAAGMIGCTVMMVTSNSSTPLLGYASGLFGICLWPLRGRMRTVRRLLVITLVSLHMVMKAPVWFLLARIDLTGSSSGYHRALLVDLCIRHFWDWWLIGTKDAGTWAYDVWDAQNQFVQVAETGGLAALVYMIVMIKRQYANLGNARKLVQDSKKQQWALWLLGSTLFAHLASFFGINYFDQVRDNWFLLLAIIVAFTNPILQGNFRKETPAKALASDSADEWSQKKDEDVWMTVPASPMSA